MTILDTAALEAGLDHIRSSPKDQGTVSLVVRRPTEGQREILVTADLHPEHGVIGDGWKDRPSRRTGVVNAYAQVTLMNARCAALIAGGDTDRWALAGDQLFVDFDLSVENIPAGTQLALGSAVLQVSAEPHTGCGKFISRFGQDAMRFVNGDVGRALNLRGINASVVVGGTVSVGDTITKVTQAAAN